MAAIDSLEITTSRSLSALLIVGTLSPVASAMSACETPANCLAARICAAVIVKAIDTFVS